VRRLVAPRRRGTQVEGGPSLALLPSYAQPLRLRQAPHTFAVTALMPRDRALGFIAAGRHGCDVSTAFLNAHDLDAHRATQPASPVPKLEKAVRGTEESVPAFRWGATQRRLEERQRTVAIRTDQCRRRRVRVLRTDCSTRDPSRHLGGLAHGCELELLRLQIERELEAADVAPVDDAGAWGRLILSVTDRQAAGWTRPRHVMQWEILT